MLKEQVEVRRRIGLSGCRFGRSREQRTQIWIILLPKMDNHERSLVKNQRACLDGARGEEAPAALAIAAAADAVGRKQGSGERRRVGRRSL